jgi:hypothetical protein
MFGVSRACQKMAINQEGRKNLTLPVAFGYASEDDYATMKHSQKPSIE